MDKTEVAVGGFIVSGGQFYGRFLACKATFDHVSQSIDCGINGQLDQPVPLGRDDSIAAALDYIFANEVSAIAFGGEQHLGCGPSAFMTGR